MTVWHSSDLGWSAGQDVSSAFASLLSSNKFKAGDTLVLEDTYKISGSHLRLPENFTLTAKDGAGLDVRTTSGTDTSPLFLLSKGVTVDNVAFEVVNAPKTSYDGILPAAGQDYHKKRVLVVEGDGVTVKDSAFSGNVSMHIDVQGGNGLTVDSSLFEGGFYQLRVVAGDGATISGSHFRKSLGDGIKTESSSSGDGPSNMTVTGSFFESNARDGLDTAGGFRNGKVLDSVFYNNGVSGFDLKSSYHDKTDFNPEKWNTNITVDGSQFINNPNGIVVSAVDRTGLLNATNAKAMPHGIHISDTIFEATGSNSGRAFLIKDGYDITWEGISLLGNVSEYRFMNASGLSLSGTNVGGEIETTGAPRKLSVSELWSGSAGPVAGGESDGGSGGSTTPEPEPAPDGDPNLVTGNAQDNTLHGTAEADIIKGLDGQDMLAGYGSRDRLRGGKDEDTVDGGGGRDKVFGGGGADTVYGGGGADVLKGGGGQDRLDGGRGNDKLNGGNGADRITGGDGSDTFVFTAGHGQDTVLDFTSGTDMIDLSGLGQSVNSYSDLEISSQGGSTLIGTGDGTILLQGIQVSELGAEDFLF
ncbi:right-handed parallel beta-helix repeat-containing protein (plasmid) [Leisingera aquaemixtae]|uniref:right-handed parallel beta-helix repeat-containing protein n=1 Tax=Leisingera aquaemixtae TaxID=1396826 RepID=UPI0021A5166C|nr:right-handed parallel beta-helix repeat-containing protein [Leisingera aquaemixtae]UWQ39574.1 right-handed parallel beta-helix repeat-containing protein [Leisingera aquaemixtae]